MHACEPVVYVRTYIRMCACTYVHTCIGISMYMYICMCSRVLRTQSGEPRPSFPVEAILNSQKFSCLQPNLIIEY